MNQDQYNEWPDLNLFLAGHSFFDLHRNKYYFGTKIVISYKRLFLSKFKIGVMKKFAVIAAVLFVVALAMSSCNNDSCPAYSQADTGAEIVA